MLNRRKEREREREGNMQFKARGQSQFRLNIMIYACIWTSYLDDQQKLTQAPRHEEYCVEINNRRELSEAENRERKKFSPSFRVVFFFHLCCYRVVSIFSSSVLCKSHREREWIQPNFFLSAVGCFQWNSKNDKLLFVRGKVHTLNFRELVDIRSCIIAPTAPH